MPTQQGEYAPMISVLMGVYYRRTDTQLLLRSIQSILLQTYPDFEFLICADGSTEPAKLAISRVAGEDPRIRLIQRRDGFSLSAKLNACLQQARGCLIARMDDDDYAHPDRFEKQAAYMHEHPEVGFVGSNVNLWRGGKHVGVRRLPERPQVHDFLFTQPFIHPAMMFRRTALLSIGGYSEDRCCLLCEDYDLLLRLYEKGFRGGNLQECLLDYTIPDTAKGCRRMPDRWNEAVTRYKRFRSLGLLPRAWPYVVKPVVVGMLPEKVLLSAKERLAGRE